MVLNDSKLKPVAVVGPTASGKSSLSNYICTNYNRDLISCDSMQIYKGMDIGTAKPTKEDMTLIHHHMIDIVSPQDNYSVSDYAKDSREVYYSLLEKNIGCVICGGTGLYLDAFLGRTNYEDNSGDEKVRKHLYEILDEKGKEYLYSLLSSIDPESAKKIHMNNTVRVIRALEIYEVTKMTKTEYDKRHISSQDIDCTIIGLEYKNRDLLRERIYKRVDIMIENGLIDEVESLYNSGILKETSTAGQGIGYKETISYLKGEFSKDELIEKIKNSSAQYAKRQLTWFRRNKDIIWLYPDLMTQDEIYEKINGILGESYVN